MKPQEGYATEKMVIPATTTHNKSDTATKRNYHKTNHRGDRKTNTPKIFEDILQSITETYRCL